MIHPLPWVGFRTFCAKQAYCGLVHHCCSQGTPSLSPSIWVPGQFARKNFASSQDVIWEQRVRPSHRNCTGACGAGVALASDGPYSCGSGVVLTAGRADSCEARFLLVAAGADACSSGVVLGPAGADCCTAV